MDAAGPETGREDSSETIKRAIRGTGTAAHPGTGTPSDAAGLLPAARAARDRLLGRDDALTRDNLAAELRRDGHPVRNARVSHLLTILKCDSPDAAPQPYDGQVLGSVR